MKGITGFYAQSRTAQKTHHNPELNRIQFRAPTASISWPGQIDTSFCLRVSNAEYPQPYLKKLASKTQPPPSLI